MMIFYQLFNQRASPTRVILDSSDGAVAHQASLP